MNANLRDFIQILLPAGIVLYAMYLTVKSFLDQEMEKKLVEVKGKNAETVLPVRLQAYERICLLLERIAPNNLLVRLNDSALSAPEFKQILLSEIRQEFSHNLSQQVYMSDQAWGATKAAMEEVVMLINTAAANLKPDATSLDLARMVFDTIINHDVDPTSRALKVVKDEIRQIF
ncbi:MAG: hypothetical protein H7Z75_04455 [Ferruginibacter sp.]|nr:hypothetical protein [Cytophagales bacterium]